MVKNVIQYKTKTLKASEWAKEHGLRPEDFLWWDTKKGLIEHHDFIKIKSQIIRNK